MSRLLVSGIACLVGVLLVAACSSSTSERDQALGALDRATQASELESQMAALVADIPSDPNPQQGQTIDASVQEIDSEAEAILASTDSGQTYDQKISEAVTETRSAGTEVTTAVDQPGNLGKARTKAIGRLANSNKNLKQATGIIGTELADEQGNLTQEDAEAFEQTLVAVDRSGEQVAAAGKDVLASRCLVRNEDGTLTKVEIMRGDVDCVEAVRVIERYRSGDLSYEGSGAFASIGEWNCGKYAPAPIPLVEAIGTACTRFRDDAQFIVRYR